MSEPRTVFVRDLNDKAYTITLVDSEILQEKKIATVSGVPLIFSVYYLDLPK